MKRVCLCLSHSIEEYDQLKLLHGLGYSVVSIGGYIRPSAPHDTKRPALDVPTYEEVASAVEAQQASPVGCAQTHIPDAVLEWLGDDGVLIWHHLLEQRLWPQWKRLNAWRRGGSGRRIIWRTVGQSVEPNERQAQAYRGYGLEIVRYSPKERNIPGYAGEDALIRFYKDPDEWGGWHGGLRAVTNVTQDMKRRSQWCNYDFWRQATAGLPVCALGPGSETFGGNGQVDYDVMREVLRSAQAYLYTGTQPASYTLGLLEALVTGVPVVSIGASHMTIFPYGPELFEGHELASAAYDDPFQAKLLLRQLLDEPELAAEVSRLQRARAVEEFGVEPVGRAWKAFLG